MQGFQHEKHSRDILRAADGYPSEGPSALLGWGKIRDASAASSSTGRMGIGSDDPRGLAQSIARQGRLAPILAALTLTACAHSAAEPVIVVKEVRVPVVTPCPIDKSEPAYVDTLDALKAAAARGSDAVVALLIGGRSQRDAQIAGLKAQAEACG